MHKDSDDERSPGGKGQWSPVPGGAQPDSWPRAGAPKVTPDQKRQVSGAKGEKCHKMG